VDGLSASSGPFCTRRLNDLEESDRRVEFLWQVRFYYRSDPYDLLSALQNEAAVFDYLRFERRPREAIPDPGTNSKALGARLS
jgi:hypothetical protein